MMKHNKKRPVGEKRNVFLFGYLIFCSVLTVAVIASVLIFYDFIRAYEDCLPEHVIESYVSSLDGETFVSLVSPELEKHASGFETDEAISRILDEVRSENTVAFTECVGNSSGAPAYDVYCGGRLMKLTLAETDGGKYGFSRYTVVAAEIYEDWISSHLSRVTVIVPDGSSVTVNGHDVPDAYLSGKIYESASLSVFERGEYKLVAYEIKNIFGKIDVTCTYRGEQLIFSKLGEDTYYSDYAIKTQFDYTIKAPKSASVTVNGTALTDDYITNSERLTGKYSELEPESLPEICTYTIPGMLSVPEVKVSLSGSELSPAESDGAGCRYEYPASHMNTYTVRVPRSMTLFCNGIEVSREYVTNTGVKYETPSAAKKYASATETYDVYEVGLYGEPNFTVSAAGAAHDSNGGVFTFYQVPSASEDKAIKAAAENFTRLFAKYTYDGFQNSEGNYGSLLSLTVSGSDAYKVITATYESFQFNSPFKMDKFELKVYDVVRYSSTCFAVKVDFSAHGKRYSLEREDVGTHQMIWVLRGGEWKLVEFIM